jgi:hypothetical protein
MSEDPKEITASVLDKEGTEVPGDSTDEQDASKNTETEKETAEAPEEKDEETPEQEETPEKEEQEESLEDKAKRYGQSFADKALKTYQQKDAEKTRLLAEQEKRIAELTRIANAKEWDKATLDLFEEESETLGEEKAVKNKAHREALKKQVMEYQENAEKVKQVASLLGDVDLETHLKSLGKPNLKDAVNFLNVAAKTQQARETAWAIEFPEDKEKLAKVQATVDRLMKAQDMTHFDLIVDSIKAERKGTKAKQVLSGTRQDGGGAKIDDLPAEELFKIGIRKNK